MSIDISAAMATIIAAVASALISAAVTLTISIITNRTQHAKYLTELHEQNKLVIYRLEQLELKVGQHNHFDSRLVALEEQVKALKAMLEQKAD